jgi:hypothetical protein
MLHQAHLSAEGSEPPFAAVSINVSYMQIVKLATHTHVFD